MKKIDKIDKVFHYLIDRAKDSQAFTIDDLIVASGWSASNTETNLSKRLSDFVRKKDGRLYANPEILRVRFSDFKDLFRQKQRLFTDYVLHVTANVLVYEFFLPLSREDRLREALDNLFYRDTVEQRIREIGLESIRNGLKLDSSYSDEAIIQVVGKFVDDTIGGYSLHIVNGRFRADALATRNEVGKRPFHADPYLIDEMTAVVRFILPVDDVQPQLVQGNLFEPAPLIIDHNEHAERMRWLFLNFFAEAVTRVVRKEDEIWLLEMGMRSGLYRWVRRDE